MKHIKHIKDERGRIEIHVILLTDSIRKYRNEKYFIYETSTYVTPPKKRLQIRDASAVTQDEILQAKLELWELIKPIL